VTPRAFLRTVVQGYAVVLISVVVAVGIAIVYLGTQPTYYRASSFVHVDVRLPQDSSAKAISAAAIYSNHLTITYKALVTSDSVLDPVITSMNLNMSANVLAGHVTPLAAQDTDIIEVRVDWPDARQGAEISNAIAAQLVSDFSKNSHPVGVELKRVTQASPGTSPVPNPVEAIGLALFAALLVSSAWLFARQVRRTSTRSTEE
jgi:capsular polysaccharide biosynthesis protein